MSKRPKWAHLLQTLYSVFYILKFKVVNYKFPLSEAESSVYMIKGFSKDMILPRLEELKGLVGDGSNSEYLHESVARRRHLQPSA